MKRGFVRALSLLTAALLTAGSLCGCGAARDTDPNPDPLPEATPTMSPEEEAEAKKRQERLEKSQDGFFWKRGYLYAVDENGDLRRDTYVGVLYFGENGRYTSGSTDLDILVAKVIRENIDVDLPRIEKLRAVYEYTRDRTKYVGFGNHDLSYEPAHGKDGWMTECAVYALENHSGNCYHFAAELAALARGLGYQAYATGGVIGSEQQPHGWVEIVDESGRVWYCDPETEYSRSYWMKEEHDLFYKSKDGISETTGLGYMQQADPTEAEEREAEERRSLAAGVKRASDVLEAEEENAKFRFVQQTDPPEAEERKTEEHGSVAADDRQAAEILEAEEENAKFRIDLTDDKATP